MKSGGHRGFVTALQCRRHLSARLCRGAPEGVEPLVDVPGQQRFVGEAKHEPQLDVIEALHSFTASRNDCRATFEQERHVAPNGQRDVMKFRSGQLQFAKLVQRNDRRRSIGASARQTCSYRDALADLYCDRRERPQFPNRFDRASNRVVRGRRQVTAVPIDPREAHAIPLFTEPESQFVGEIDGVEDALDVVIAVAPFRADAQEEIDLGARQITRADSGRLVIQRAWKASIATAIATTSLRSTVRCGSPLRSIV